MWPDGGSPTHWAGWPLLPREAAPPGPAARGWCACACWLWGAQQHITMHWLWCCPAQWHGQHRHTAAHLQCEQYLVPREHSFKLIPQLNTVKMNEKIGHVHRSFHELFQCTLILIAVLLIFGLTNLDFYRRRPLSSTFVTCLITSAWKSSIRRFVSTEKAPTRAFSWLKTATTAFTFKTLLRHYAKRTLTPR